MKKNNMLYTIFLVFCCFFMAQSAFCASKDQETYDFFEKSEQDSVFKINIDKIAREDNIFNLQLKKAYTNNAFRPLWINDEYGIERLEILKDYLSDIESHGILKERFDIDTISYLIENLKKWNCTIDDFIALDIIATKNYLKYCAGLNYGFLQPDEICSKNYYYKTQAVSEDFVKKCIAKTADLAHFLDSIQPKSDLYKALQKERKHYLENKDSVSFFKIPELKNRATIKLGSKHPTVALLAKRLLLSKELSEEQAKAALEQNLFDQNLLDGLDVFRKKTGQLLDKEIGNGTIKALNTSYEEFIDKIDINLERLRWKPEKALAGKYIRVNVANMTLAAYKADTLVLKMKVCVGKPGKNMTPFLQADIHEIVLNPKWHIPSSIITEEVAPGMVRDSAYISKRNMRVFVQGQEIDPSTVEWDKVNKNSQPYAIVQDAGSFNSLGRIKFNFHNRHSVYLHDTNSKSAFKRHNRAISHGCVRVEKPIDLAFFCLSEIDRTNQTELDERELYEDKILFSISQTPKSKKGKELVKTNSSKMKLNSVNLSPKIPLILEYHTCSLDENANLVLNDDVYGLDACVIKHLRAYK